MQEITNSMKRRFLKDFGLPLQIVQEPHFSYGLRTIDKEYNSLAKYELFLKTIEILGDQNILDYVAELVQTIISDIKSKDAFKTFKADNLEKYNLANSKNKKGNLYIEDNIDVDFVSIDLIKANFNALREYDENILPQDYEEFISKYTELEYFKQSKYLRQMIFGNLEPKKQQKIQRFIISDIANKLNGMNIFTSSTDELVVRNSEELVVRKSDLEEVLQRLAGTYNFLRIESFTLKNILNDYYVREYEDKVEFKQCSSIVFLQILKYYRGEPILEEDRKFYYERQIATFDQSIIEDMD